MKSSIQNEKKIMYKHKSLIAKNCLALKRPPDPEFIIMH